MSGFNLYRPVVCLIGLIFAAAGCNRDMPSQLPPPLKTSDASQTELQPGSAPVPESTAKPGGTASSARQKPTGTSRERFDGFSFELPTGWTRVAPDRPKTKAMLLLGADRWDTAKGMIKVDSGDPSTADPKAMADGLAKDFGGTVQSELSAVDGEQAFQVHAPQGNSMSPRNALIIFRGGKAFLIMAGAVGGTDVSTALEHVRATWKWAE